MWTVEEWDATDDSEAVPMLVHRDGNSVQYIEIEFLDGAFRLRDADADAFEGIWTLLNLLNDRVLMDGLTG